MQGPQQPKRRTMWRAMAPVPPEAPECDFKHAHYKLADELARYAYRRHGELWGWCVYYRRSTSALPTRVFYTWCVDESDERRLHAWHAKLWEITAAQPLYLAAGDLPGDKALPVVVVPTEADAEAGHALLGDRYAFVAYPGSPQSAAWSWIEGRPVVLWPAASAERKPLTADEKLAGLAADAQPYLPSHKQHGHRRAAEVGMAVAPLATIVAQCVLPEPGSVAEGWGAAAARAAGWGATQLAEFLAGAQPWVAPAAKRRPHPADDAAIPPSDAQGREVPELGGWRDLLLRTDKGGKRDCRDNVMICLTHHPDLQGLVGFNAFAHRVLKLRTPPWGGKPGDWTSADDYELGFWLAQHERLVIAREATLVAGVEFAASRNKFHPVRQYLDALPAWDGTERLKHWLADCLGAVAEDPTYLELVGAWYVMGMVNRVLHPGCQMDYMIVLEGKQGKRKSTALRTLAVRDEWFADTPIRVGDKDALLSLAGIWLYEIGEMDSFNRAETTAVKQYVSSREDWLRPPFKQRFEERPRSGVFGGTTNQHEYFKDSTGARRMWPVACEGEIDIERLRDWRDQMFAEALHRLRSADEDERRYYPTIKETDRWLKPEQEKREINDPWFDRIAVWVDCDLSFGTDQIAVSSHKSFTTHQLLTGALNVSVDKIDGARQMATRVGIVMHRLGWDKRRDNHGARLWRYWRPAKKAGEEPSNLGCYMVGQGVGQRLDSGPQGPVEGESGVAEF